MPLSWMDTEGVAAALQAAHPEAEPQEVPPDQLRAWAAALTGLAEGAADAMDEATLRAVRMLWYERSQAEESDVSG